MGIWQRMEQRAQRRDVAVAVVGAGFVGRGVVYQLQRSIGMRPALVVNRSVERAVDAFVLAGWPGGDVVVSDDPVTLGEAVGNGRPAVTSSPGALPEVRGVDVVVEVTGAIGYGARTILGCLEGGQDVVSLNAEVDATVGHLLHDTAQRHGAIYTIADGDQPGVLLRLMDFVRGMGFQVTAALNCKRNLDVHQNPDDSARYSARDGTSVLMTTAFGDGTKMQVENAVVANLTGLVPDRRGMHGVRTTLATAVEDVLGTVSHRGVVEFTLGGDFAAGVCVIAHAPDPEVAGPYMRFLKMGEGPDYLFFRPYHLVHLEVPITVAEVVLDRHGLGLPAGSPVADVVAVAKRDLGPGDPLDGIGGFGCYGHVDTVQRAEGLLPVGLSAHARMTRSVRRDEPIPLDAVELDTDADIVRLRRRQDELVTAGARVPSSRPL